jgi:MerR family mercuric resistance operon transcriptional regulator
MTPMTIGRAARKAGVGVETIRFYERKRLIEQPPKPRDSGFRDYPMETVHRIRFIRHAQEIGFSLREIEELLSLRADPAADCGEVRERATAKLQEVNRKIAQLERIRGGLEDLIAACPGRGALRACSILDALTDTEEDHDGEAGVHGRSG